MYKRFGFFFPINFCSIFAVKMQNVLSFVLQHPVLDRLKDLNWFVLLLCRKMKQGCEKYCPGSPLSSSDHYRQRWDLPALPSSSLPQFPAVYVCREELGERKAMAEET